MPASNGYGEKAAKHRSPGWNPYSKPASKDSGMPEAQVKKGK